MGSAVKISSKYQIVIPKEVRERKGWKPGQELVFVPDGDGYVLVPALEIEDLRGIAKGLPYPTDYRDRNDRY